MSGRDEAGATNGSPSGRGVLSAEAVAFFKANGYIVLRQAMDADACAIARDRLWASLPDSVRLRRDEPKTWVGPFSPDDESHDDTHSRLGFRWQVREFGADRDMVELAFNPTIVTAAEQLLGIGTLRPPIPGGSIMGTHGAAWPGGPVDPCLGVDGTRGVYCTLPYGELPAQPIVAHTDGHPFHLSAVGLIDNVPPGGGGFAVWPASHRRLYPTFQLQYDQPRIPSYPHLPSAKGILHSEAYLSELETIMADTELVDCWGSVGDVVLWHHRLAHMAAHNTSSVIRQAILFDFSTVDLDRQRLDPPQDDMWRDWSDEVRSNTASFSADFARSQGIH